MSGLFRNGLAFWEVVAVLAPMGGAVLVYWYVKARDTLNQVETMLSTRPDDQHGQGPTAEDTPRGGGEDDGGDREIA